jgi:glycosyltransferase involved in cell wall biosynthesis
MKILLVNYLETTFPGGISKTVNELAQHLSKNHEVTVLQPNPSNLKAEELNNGFKIIRVSSQLDNTKYFYGLNFEIYKYLKNHYKDLNPDIVHVHGYHHLMPIESIHIIKRMDPNIPLIFSPYLDVARGRFAGKYLWNLYNIFARTVFSKSDNVTCCSQFESANIQKIGVENEKITVIPLGVDIINLKKDHKDKKLKKTINLLYTGHIIPRKGVDYILKTLHSLVHKNGIENVVLTVVGEGPEKNKLIKMADRLEISDHIQWKSFLSREELINLIQESDIYLLLSRSEAYGIAVAEALALGTPCIISHRTALKEFSNEIGCYTVEYPPVPDDVANIVLKIYAEEIGVGPLSERIRTWDEVTKDYEKLYQHAVSNNNL